MKLSESLQKAAEAVVGVDVKGTAPGASISDYKTSAIPKAKFLSADDKPSSTKAEWGEFEKAVADPIVEIDAYYRKAFRGRTAQMLAVRHSREFVSTRSR